MEFKNTFEDAITQVLPDSFWQYNDKDRDGYEVITIVMNQRLQWEIIRSKEEDEITIKEWIINKPLNGPGTTEFDYVFQGCFPLTDQGDFDSDFLTKLLKSISKLALSRKLIRF